MFRLYTVLIALISASCSSSLQSFKRHVGGEPEVIRVKKNSRSKDRRSYGNTINYQEEEVVFDDSYIPASRRDPHNPYKNQKTQNASLWDGSGQQNYLFSRNLQKSVGDLVTIRLDKKTKRQLIDEYEAEYASITTRKKRSRYMKHLLGSKEEFSRKEVKRLLKKNSKYSERLYQKKKAPKSSKKRILSSDEITARVVQVMPNGAYKIQGVQRLVVKKKPYKMILAGMIKSADIGPDDSVISSRMIDTKIKFKRIR
jgi:flagellar L-ring protein precursor FlgH